MAEMPASGVTINGHQQHRCEVDGHSVLIAWVRVETESSWLLRVAATIDGVTRSETIRRVGDDWLVVNTTGPALDALWFQGYVRREDVRRALGMPAPVAEAFAPSRTMYIYAPGSSLVAWPGVTPTPATMRAVKRAEPQIIERKRRTIVADED